MTSTTQEELYPHEKPTLSLVGDSFFYSGSDMSCGRIQDAIGLPHELEYNHHTDSEGTVYVVLGPRQHYFRCTRPKGGEIAAINASDIEDFDDMAIFLDEHDVERPAFLSMGLSGSFYIRAENGAEKWDLPRAIRERLFGKAATGSQVQSIWLGCKDAFVAQRADGSKVVDLRGQYPGLERALDRGRGSQNAASGNVVALALNLYDGVRFAVLWGDGYAMCEAGMMEAASGKAFERWCSANRFILSV
ncbi:hypothetical protein AK830_g6233 [Neonectria ditissima]|uniref:Uncharacterized protein n=1 Tax=Neonectria ditissima TaxID=78410 RepID=A0A0P7BJ15_9HYPO|nr:hypothetical protein AK830_g6233 [Neonectria ditissima]